MTNQHAQFSNHGGFIGDFLTCFRGNEELDVLLNKTGPPDLEMYEPLARLNLAIQYGQKKV